jgi:uncharacterized protein
MMGCFMTTVVYHSADDDGRCSAAIVKMKYPDCTLIGTNYGKSIPWNMITKGETVFVVDFCIEPVEDMIRLSKMCELVWIDHHKSSIEMMREAGLNPDGLRVIGKAACELTWEFLFKGKKMPTAVYLIGRYDVWDHEADLRTLPFMYGMRLEDARPTNEALWFNLLSEDTSVAEKILENGNITFPYQVKEDERMAKARAFETTFDGYKAIVMNTGGGNSLAFDSVWDETKHDIMIAFIYNAGKVTVSIYTKKLGIDCSKIAMKYDGGGHLEASGCIFDDTQKFFEMISVNK